MEKGLVRIAGRHDSLGRPVLYGTTQEVPAGLRPEEPARPAPGRAAYVRRRRAWRMKPRHRTKSEASGSRQRPVPFTGRRTQPRSPGLRSDVVVQGELVRMRPQPDRLDFLLRLYQIQVSITSRGEDVAAQQELVVASPGASAPLPASRASWAPWPAPPAPGRRCPCRAARRA